MKDAQMQMKTQIENEKKDVEATNTEMHKEMMEEQEKYVHLEKEHQRPEEKLQASGEEFNQLQEKYENIQEENVTDVQVEKLEEKNNEFIEQKRFRLVDNSNVMFVHTACRCCCYGGFQQMSLWFSLGYVYFLLRVYERSCWLLINAWHTVTMD